MGVSLKSIYMLVKYLGALFLHIRRKKMLFIPNTIDEAIIQAQYLEGDKRKPQTTHKQVEPQEKERKRKNKKKWNEKKIVEAKQEETYSIQQCKGCDLKGHTEENYWKLHPEKRPKYFRKERRKH
jgi:hypothetical protein